MMETPKGRRVPIWARLEAPDPAPFGTKAAVPEGHLALRLRRRFAWGVLAVCTLAAFEIVLFRGWGRQYFASTWTANVGFFSRLSPPLFPSLLVIGTIVLLLLWKLPKWQVARSKALTDENRFDRENEARKTLSKNIGRRVRARGTVFVGADIQLIP